MRQGTEMVPLVTSLKLQELFEPLLELQVEADCWPASL